MPMPTLLTGFNIANVELIKIVTKGTNPETYYHKVTTSFSAEAKISDGEEKEQRIKNQVMGRIKTEALLMGYDLKCEDERLIMEMLELIDGGTYDPENLKYSAPKVGIETLRKKFDTYMYTSDRNSSGEVNVYLEWFFPMCNGKPVKVEAKDGEFSKMSYEIESRAPDGESPFEVCVVDKLPTEA